MRNVPHKLRYLNTGSPVGGAAWRSYGEMQPGSSRNGSLLGVGTQLRQTVSGPLCSLENGVGPKDRETEGVTRVKERDTNLTLVA